jgi:3-oxoacyl-[acyl-carrier-protein] synthase II
MSCDAHHVTTPPPDGDGALRCMRAALADANLTPSAVDYISAHATSTPIGDEIELRAIHALLSRDAAAARARAQPTAVSSTKGATGHLLGAAGAVEAAFSVLAVHRGLAPPGVNLREAVQIDGPESGIETSTAELVHLNDLPVPLRGAADGGACVALSNSFGFGGTNASLVFRTFDG